MINTIISLYYYLLVVKAMFVRQDECVIPSFKSAFSERLGMVICTLGIIFIGLASCIYGYLSAVSTESVGLFAMI